MTHTIHSLITTILRSNIPANDIIMYLETIFVLRKRYGKSLYHNTMIETIEKAEPGVSSLLRLLIIHNATEASAIKQLIRSIKQQSEKYILQFKVLVPKDEYLYPIQEKLKKKFPNSEVYKQSHINVGIEITGEGRHYKRNLDKDIEKLLG